MSPGGAATGLRPSVSGDEAKARQKGDEVYRVLTMLMGIAVVLVGSFLLGSIPFGYLIGRIGYGKDPRTSGSGSIGMTNMNRLFGIKAAALTFIGDVAKGMAAAGLACVLLPHIAVVEVWQADFVLVVSVAGAVFGHVFCPWLGFKGGKGISTGFGSILVAFPLVAVTILVVFLVCALATKRISVGSIAAAVAFPVDCCAYHWGSWALIAVSIVTGLAVVIAHRGNIQRLIAGAEPTFSFNSGAGAGEGADAGEDAGAGAGEGADVGGTGAGAGSAAKKSARKGS